VLAQEARLSRQHGSQFGVLMIDIDHFKRINDALGHHAGDSVLASVAGVLMQHVRASDFVFRYGGEEFLVILGEISPTDLLARAEVIRAAVEAFRYADVGTRVTVSVGGALYDGHPDYERTVRMADELLYEAKRAGRNRVAVTPA
jgi:diguanylate cyclase